MTDHPALRLALAAIAHAPNDAVLDAIAEDCEQLWQKMRPLLVDACDLDKLLDDIAIRRDELRKARIRDAASDYMRRAGR